MAGITDGRGRNQDRGMDKTKEKMSQKRQDALRITHTLPAFIGCVVIQIAARLIRASGYKGKDGAERLRFRW